MCARESEGFVPLPEVAPGKRLTPDEMIRGIALNVVRRAHQRSRDVLTEGISLAVEASNVQGPGCCSLPALCENPGSPWGVRGFAARWYSAAAQPAAAAPQTSVGDLVIHPSAVQRLKQLQAQHPGQSVLLRIEVEGGGCSGFQYKFSLNTGGPSSTDKVFEVEGARVVCDPDSFELLRGSRVEFEDTLMRQAFVVGANPNSEASCGCGSSFTAKMPAITRPGQAKATS